MAYGGGYGGASGNGYGGGYPGAGGVMAWVRLWRRGRESRRLWQRQSISAVDSAEPARAAGSGIGAAVSAAALRLTAIRPSAGMPPRRQPCRTLTGQVLGAPRLPAGAGPIGAVPARAAPQQPFTTAAAIVPNPLDNALIIQADAQQYQNILKILKELDFRRARFCSKPKSTKSISRTASRAASIISFSSRAEPIASLRRASNATGPR